MMILTIKKETTYYCWNVENLKQKPAAQKQLISTPADLLEPRFEKENMCRIHAFSQILQIRSLNCTAIWIHP